MKKHLLLLCSAWYLLSVVKAQTPYPSAPAAAENIVQAEYFFDVDPGTGNAGPLSITANTQISDHTTNLALTGAALTPGLHRLYIRTKDASGAWSLTNNAFFSNVVIVPYPTTPATPDIIKAEYFFDADPGPGNGVEIAFPASANMNGFNALIPLTGLNPGIHQLYIRAMDASGKWSLTNYSLFNNAVFTPYPQAPAPAPAISQAEYYLDNDPGFGMGTPIAIPATTDIAAFSFDIPLGAVSQGRHTIYVRSRQNPWSLSAYAEFIYGSTLPLTWLYVKAEEKNSAVYLQWATGTEENTRSFIIEYSTNGTHFTAVGEVAATNNSAGSNYTFTHQSPASGVAYYRIKQMDKDGRYAWSKIIMLLIDSNLKDPVLFPNPAKAVVHLMLPERFKAEQIAIHDANGRLVKTIAGMNTNSVQTIAVGDLKKGYYFVSIKTSGGRKTLPFLKE
jgi:hypothetical protein